MANKYVKQGLVPVNLEPDGVVTLAKDASSTYDLFIGSPVVVSSGKFTASTTTGSITGSVVALYDSNGKPVSNLATTAAGKVTATCKSYQVFKITCSGTQVAASDADIGKTYDTTAEGGTVESTTTLGSTYSTRQLDGTTEHASNGHLTLGKIVPRNDNDGGVDGTEVYVTITAANFTGLGA